MNHPPSPPVDTESSAQPLDYPSGSTDRIFTVGTLRYTFAGLCIVFGWLLIGDFAIAMRDRSMDPMVKLVLQEYQATDFRMTLLTTVLPMSIGLLLAPIISFNSDRHRGRWGRRIPYLLIPTPIITLAMFGLAYCPRLGHLVAHLSGTTDNNAALTLFSIFWVAYEFGFIIAGAVFYGLINDVVPPQFLGRFFGLFRIVSLGAGVLFNRWIIGVAKQHELAIFTSMGLLFGIGVTIMCLMVKEGEYPPPVHDPNDPRTRGLINNIRIYCEECYCHPYYLWIFLAFFFASITFSPYNTYSLYYAQQIKMDVPSYGRLIADSYTISICLAFPLGWLVDRFHALRVSMFTLALYATSVTYGWFFVHDPKTFGIALVAHTVLSGTYFTTSAPLGLLLYPRAKYGQYNSAGQIILNLFSIGWNFCMGLILDASHHNYRLTFMMGLVFCLTALLLFSLAYFGFKRHGGPCNYVAPEPDDQSPLHAFPME